MNLLIKILVAFNNNSNTSQSGGKAFAWSLRCLSYCFDSFNSISSMYIVYISNIEKYLSYQNLFFYFFKALQ